MRVHAETAEQYADFATYAETDSPCFADWATRVVADRELLAWLEELPVGKRQPNLVFAAARWHGVPAPAPYEALREALLGDDGSIVATVRSRATQTNEVGRLATLLPALARVEAEDAGPLALVEVGASAGLCLYPDRFAYRWSGATGETVLPGPDDGAHELLCEVRGAANQDRLPDRLPEVAWRGGVDLSPVDVTDDDAMAWLATLVWPEHEDRRRRLAAAVAVARTDPPTLLTGDLLTELPALVDLARGHGRVVVFHSAVAAYLTEPDRDAFASMMASLVADGACRWISNEAPAVLPSVTATAGDAQPPPGSFALGLDGRALAWTHGHGRWLTWL